MARMASIASSCSACSEVCTATGHTWNSKRTPSRTASSKASVLAERSARVPWQMTTGSAPSLSAVRAQSTAVSVPPTTTTRRPTVPRSPAFASRRNSRPGRTSAGSWPASSSGRFTRAPLARKMASCDSSSFHERLAPTRTPQWKLTPCERMRSISLASTSRGRWYSGMP